MARMIVREDDTMVCSDCYMEDREDARPFDLPAYRCAFKCIDAGICEQCGKVEE